MNRKTLILILASAGTFVEALDIAIINLTVPAIQEQFGIGPETVQWLQTLYVLFFGGFLIIGGKLSDQLGRKKVFLLGALIFMLTSLGAGLSTGFEALAVFRALQGLGAALIMPSAMSIVTHTFTGDQERNRAVGIFSSFAAIGSGSGLSLGGIISTYLSWHWVFLINVPVLLVALILAFRYLPEDPEARSRKTDITSGIFLVLGLLSLTYGTHELTHVREHPLPVAGALAASAVLLGAVLYRLKTAPEPLMDLHLFRFSSLKVSSLAFVALGAFFIGFLFLISLMLQKDMQYSAASAGLLLVPFSIMSALMAKFVLPSVSRRLNSAQMGIFGWSFMLGGSLLLLASAFTGHPLLLVLLGAACISGIGMTFCFTALSVLGIQEVRPPDYGVASSVGSTSYFLGGGIGLSFMTLLGSAFPSEAAAGSSSLLILTGYALTALSVLAYFIIQSRKAAQQEAFVS